MMKRREWLAGISLALFVAAPLHALAQAAASLPRVVYVSLGTEESARRFVDAFLQGMESHGYREGRNVLIEVRLAPRIELFSAMVREVVASRPTVLVVSGSHAAQAAKQATSSIPIVLGYVGDPLGQGLVASLARPGGNITGNAILSESVAAKRLELIMEIVPRAKRVGYLVNPANPATNSSRGGIMAVAKMRSCELVEFRITNEAELDDALAQLASQRLDGAFVAQDALFNMHRRKIAQGLARARIAAVHGYPEAAQDGGLAGYAVSTGDILRNAAKFVHRILQGAKPGELPVEQATRLEMAINLKAAKALGITIPQSVMLRADQVIE